MDWLLLPPVTEDMKAVSFATKGRFRGDPSYEYEHLEVSSLINCVHSGDYTGIEDFSLDIKYTVRKKSRTLYAVDVCTQHIPYIDTCKHAEIYLGRLSTFMVFLLNPWLQSKVSEETRLAVVTHQIDEEASVVPRGAFIRDLRGLVQVNRSFGGK